MRLLCVALLVTEKCSEIVLKFSKILVLKFYFVLQLSAVSLSHNDSKSKKK